MILPIGIFGIISWSIWLYRRTMSHLAKPTINAFTTTSSLVVPVYGEDPVVLSQCLDTWIAAGPTEIILVLDVNDHECLNMLASREKPDWVRVLVFAHRGKRSALGVGIRAATSEIVIMADSDTAWSPDLLRNVLMPFASGRWVASAPDKSLPLATPRSGGGWPLAARHQIPRLRAGDGAKGAVPCVSGRTAAYRRAVVTPLLPYLGTRCTWGASASPATTAASPGWCWAPAISRCIRGRRWRSRCSPTPSGPSSNSASDGAETPTVATQPRCGRAGSGTNHSSPS